jgi:hypothetical protein
MTDRPAEAKGFQPVANLLPHRPRPGYALTLALGVAVGWAVSGTRPNAIRAGGGDRWDESVLTSGPASVRYNESSKVQVAHDAIYYLDYRGAKLLGTIPSFRQVAGSTKVISAFAERDLVADFKLDLDTGPRPHFLMTTGSLYTGTTSLYGDGWAPLYVFESTTRQVAVYRIQQQSMGSSATLGIDLLEIRPFSPKPSASH